MHARMFTYQVNPEKMEERIRYGREILPHTRARAGFRGLLLLVDRQTNRNIAVQLWDSEADLRASAADDAYAALLPHHPARGFADGPVRVEEFEVAVHEPGPAPVG